MLSFHFTGVDGSMTEAETLTSGMVGKQISLSFDESWAELSKTAVFCAGETTRVVMDPGETLTVPADVLARPYCKLFVGIYGTDAAGTVVIPTVMAEGPMIRRGADPIEDETAEELPVWKDLQNQINTLSGRVAVLEESSGRFTAEAAQMLVDILSKGLYTSDQKEQVEALAAAFGVSVSEDLSHLTHYWDFRTGSLTDRIGGLEAVTSDDVTLDTMGAHVPTANSYIMFPAGADGASLSGHTAEVKFGDMTLDETASTQRLLLISTGLQPASQGLQWTVRDCWSCKSSVLTEFTDLNMFSGKSLILTANDDSSLLEWYIDGQLIASTAPTAAYTHLSIGTSSGGAFPLTVEYVRIYPNS